MRPGNPTHQRGRDPDRDRGCPGQKGSRLRPTLSIVESQGPRPDRRRMESRPPPITVLIPSLSDTHKGVFRYGHVSGTRFQGRVRDECTPSQRGRPKPVVVPQDSTPCEEKVPRLDAVTQSLLFALCYKLVRGTEGLFVDPKFQSPVPSSLLPPCQNMDRINSYKIMFSLNHYYSINRSFQVSSEDYYNGKVIIIPIVSKNKKITPFTLHQLRLIK